MNFNYGDELRAEVMAPLLDNAPYMAVNLVNDYGMEEHGAAGAAMHDNHPQGSSMWMISGRRQDFEIVFDFGGFYPLYRAIPGYIRPCVTSLPLSWMSYGALRPGIELTTSCWIPST